MNPDNMLHVMIMITALVVLVVSAMTWIETYLARKAMEKILRECRMKSFMDNKKDSS